MTQGEDAGSGRTESVWDYPRPPRLELAARRVSVRHGGVVIADSVAAWRVLETSHPPVYYVPRAEITGCELLPSARHTFCEFKGVASYWHLRVGGDMVWDAGWSYESPSSSYAALAGAVAFYPSKVDECLVAGERVSPQPGDFYGGWVTSDVVGPFKGGPGTSGW